MMVLPRFDVAGRVALVTGAARGLGRAIALALAASGADLALGLRDARVDTGLVGEIESLGRHALPLPMEVSTVGEVKAAVQAAAEHFGRLPLRERLAAQHDRSTSHPDRS